MTTFEPEHRLLLWTWVRRFQKTAA